MCKVFKSFWWAERYSEKIRKWSTDEIRGELVDELGNGRVITLVCSAKKWNVQIRSKTNRASITKG